MSVPPHKAVPGTRFAVDCFRLRGTGCSAFFLTHGHSDHYGGLDARWDEGPVYCSELTARLVPLRTGVSAAWLHVLPLNEPVDVAGVTVVAVDANHCPGAVMLLFALPDGRRFIHTGDFRYDDSMTHSPHLQAWREAGVEKLFLDTTYCRPKHTFPPQETAVSYCARVAREALASPRTVVLVSTYGVGKERVLSACAASTGVSVCVDADRLGVLRVLDLPDVGIYSTEPSPLRVVGWGKLGETWPFFKPNWTAMEELRRSTGAERVVGLVPTGWMYEMKAGMERGEFPIRRKGDCEIHLVPYSEHSSYEELRSFVRWLRPQDVIPTVGVDQKADTREGERARAAMLGCFSTLVDDTKAKRAFFKTSMEAAEQQQRQAGQAAADEAAATMEMEAAEQQQRQAGQAAAGEAAATTEQPGMADDDEVQIIDAPPSPAAAAADSAVAELCAVLGDGVSERRARELLHTAGGDMNAAVNLFFERGGNGGGSGGGGAAKKRRSGDGGAAGRGGAQSSIQSFFGKPPVAPATLTPIVHSSLPSPTIPPRPPLPLPLPPPPPSVPQPEPPGMSAADAMAHLSLPSAQFDPAVHACWRAGQPAPYAHLASTCAALCSTKSRLAIAQMLTNSFRALVRLSPQDVLPSLCLLTGNVTPASPQDTASELHCGGAAVSAAIREATGASAAQLSAAYHASGDLGDAAAQLKCSQRLLKPPPPLTVADLLSQLHSLAAAGGGTGAALRRKVILVALLRATRGVEEPRFLVRSVLGAMRIGASRLTVLASLSAAVAIEEAHAQSQPLPGKEQLEECATVSARAYALCPSFAVLVPALLSGTLQTLGMQPGTPCAPMLAQPTRGAAEALGRLGEEASFLAEWKYDGQRCQAHILPSSAAMLFTRSGADCTASFPDVVSALLAAAGQSAGGTILDAEVVAVDAQGGVRPFQELSTRARGAVTSAAKVSIGVRLVVFDCLMRKGVSLLDEPLAKRREEMKAALPHMDGCGVCIATSVEFSARVGGEGEEAAALEAALKCSVADCCEGLMLKRLSDPYEPDKRTRWMKLKKDYLEGCGDSLDLVPIGAWMGSGRKHKFYSPFLCAVYDRERECWDSVCRVMSGFSDAVYQQLFDFFNQPDSNRILDAQPPYITTRDTPAFWLAPCCVFEVRGADLSLSPTHTAAQGLAAAGSERGIALRFPRFLRTRDDLTAENATGPEQLLEMYLAQPNRGAAAGPADDDEF
jgi:ATP-dependent DNA ligase I